MLKNYLKYLLKYIIQKNLNKKRKLIEGKEEINIKELNLKQLIKYITKLIDDNKKIDITEK